VLGDRISVPNMGIYTIVSNNVASKKITLALDRKVSGEYRLYGNMGDAILYSKSVGSIEDLENQIRLLTVKVAELDSRVDKLETRP
jgi:hypothetical protein